jgi:NTP pyrophosphatase (non-canonical NTP hydrolase)
MRYGTEVLARMFVRERERQIINAYTGLTAEAGEVADYYKKLLFHPPHPKNPTKEDLRKELGDVLWYLACLAELEFGVSLKQIALENIHKLKQRWPERYSNVNEEELTL